MSKRFVEVKGIGIPNKGAELMLIAVQEQIGAILPSHYFCCEPTTEFLPRARYGLFQRTGFTFRNRYIEWTSLARLIPARVRDRYGLVTEDQVDIVIDASGFAYGDQWGAEKAYTRLGKNIAGWKKEGKKVILLPQAFGPFTGHAIRQEMRCILECADLVFARDRQSLAHLNKLMPGKAHLGPDFTNLVSPPQIPIRYQQYVGRPCLIPNQKMITMVKDNQDYVKSMARCLSVLQDSGELPFILIHEGHGDIQLAKEIVSYLSRKIDIVVPNDALVIKAIIGQCSFVISSRFHGLVSALSQGVPVVATGWSHKYQELLGDYNVSEFVAVGAETEEFIITKTKLLLDDTQRSIVKNKIDKEREKEKLKTKEMWKKVSDFLSKEKVV